MARSIAEAVSEYTRAMEMAFDLDEVLTVAEGSCRRMAATKSYVSNLPTVVFPADHDVCSVCMEGFQQKLQSVDEQTSNSNKRVPCGHLYHATCITNWLSLFNTCPLCRSKFQLDSEYE